MIALIHIPIPIAMFPAVNRGASATAFALSLACGFTVIRKSLIPQLFGRQPGGKDYLLAMTMGPLVIAPGCGIL